MSRFTDAPPWATKPLVPFMLAMLSWTLAKMTPAPAPLARKPSVFLLSWTRCRATPWMKLMPISPLPTPSISSPRRMTLAPAPLTLMPLVRAARTPAIVLVQSMVIDLVMVTAPNPPESRQLMMPLTAVLEIAPANVLHGAVRLHGLASSPTPETQVRVAWACAGSELSKGTHSRLMAASSSEVLMTFPPVFSPRDGRVRLLLTQERARHHARVVFENSPFGCM